MLRQQKEKQKEKSWKMTPGIIFINYYYYFYYCLRNLFNALCIITPDDIKTQMEGSTTANTTKEEEDVEREEEQ